MILLSFLALSYSMHRAFDHDEFAHIHSAWYVANGYTPYTDFFHNHHPLLWYCIAPFRLILGNSIQTGALAEIDRDYTVFIRVADQNGRIWAQQDTLLLSVDRATSAWTAGETVKQQYNLALPTGTPAGVEIWVGMYCWQTEERLPVWDEYGRRVADDAILLLTKAAEWEAA